jgi:hypothetical protein
MKEALGADEGAIMSRLAIAFMLALAAFAANAQVSNRNPQQMERGRFCSMGE